MRKPVPGKRFFKCDECNHEWIEPCRDCLSPSGSTCPNEDCYSFTSPDDYQKHPEWPTDCGNLIKGYDYLGKGK